VKFISPSLYAWWFKLSHFIKSTEVLVSGQFASFITHCVSGVNTAMMIVARNLNYKRIQQKTISGVENKLALTYNRGRGTNVIFPDPLRNPPKCKCKNYYVGISIQRADKGGWVSSSGAWTGFDYVDVGESVDNDFFIRSWSSWCPLPTPLTPSALWTQHPNHGA
jgi:hypothetical protein